MFLHYIKIFFRNLGRQRLFASFNIFGLAIGFTTFILIALLVQYEYSYDKFHKNLDRIYRVEEMAHLADGDQFWSQTCYPIADRFKAEFPEIEDAVVTRPVWGDYLSTSEKLTFHEPDGLYASNSLFNMFSFEFIEGDSKSALTEPSSIVLTEELAKKYFSDGHAMGQLVTIRNHYPFKVTGIIREMPDNSTLQPSYICSIDGLETLDRTNLEDNWNDYSYYTYILLNEGSHPDEFKAKIAGYMLDKDEKTKGTLMLRPYSIIHLKPSNIGGMYLLVYLYSIVAILALLIAAINFINLTTAYADSRGKEIGIKKVVGGKRSALFLQFITESISLSLISLLIAFIISEISIPLFNRIVDRQLEIQYLENFEFVLFIICIATAIGLLSGIYPSLYLSSFKPVRFLRFSSTGNGGKNYLRKSLVVVQFVVATFLILTTIMIYRQFNYHDNKDPGFSKENVLFAWIKINAESSNLNFDIIRDKLISEPEIVNTSISSNIPFNGSSGTIVNWEGAYEGEQLNIRRNWVNYDYNDVFELGIVRGRNFSRDIKSDLDGACIINETAVRSFGWSDPIGKKISDINGKEYNVIGVIKDHHLYTTILNIPPSLTILHDGNTKGNHVYSFKVSENATFEDAREKIQSVFKAHYPDVLFEVRSLEDNMDYENLKAYKGMANTIGFFSIITIGIAVVGLLGLVAYSTKIKTKEIGIRKIHGATPGQIFVLLGKEFVMLLIIANLIALPLGAVNKVMDPAQIKVESSPWEYILTAGIIIFVALMTISYHTIKASISNPVDSLRYE
ncbi:ABC transporter permease [Bacteroidota bacterium]